MKDFKVEQGTSLQEAVFTALGAASVCWDPMDGTGVFRDDWATRIGEELVEAIRDGRVYDRETGLGVKVSRWQPLGKGDSGGTVLTAPAGTPEPEQNG